MTSGGSFDQWLLFYLKWFPLHGSNCSEYFIYSKSFNLGPRMRMRFRGFLPPSGGHVRSGPQARPYAHCCFLKAGAVGQHAPWPSPGACGGRAHKQPVRCRVGLTLCPRNGVVSPQVTHMQKGTNAPLVLTLFGSYCSSFNPLPHPTSAATRKCRLDLKWMKEGKKNTHTHFFFPLSN